MRRKPGETIQELATRIRQDAVTCDFPAIKDPLDEAMRTRFISSVDNEAVLFRIKDNDLSFAKAIAVAVETEEATKVAKETVYGTSSTLSSSVNKVQGRKQSGENQFNSRFGNGGKKQIFPWEHALSVVRVTMSRRTAPFEKLFVIFAKRWDTYRQSV